MEGNHSPETAIALLELRMKGIAESVKEIKDNMVTHADLDRLATKDALSLLADRVKDLERGTLKKVLGSLTTFAAGGVTLYAALEVIGKLFGKGH